MKNDGENIEANCEVSINGNMEFSASFNIYFDSSEDVETFKTFLFNLGDKKFKAVKSGAGTKIVVIDEESGWARDKTSETILSLEI